MRNVQWKLIAVLVTMLTAGVASNARALEPELAFFETRSTLEELAMREIREKVLASSEREGDFNPMRTIYAGSVKLTRGKFSPGTFSEYFGTLKAEMLEADGQGHEYACRIAAQVRKVPFAKQGNDVVILDQVVNRYQVVAKPRIECRPTPGRSD